METFKLELFGINGNVRISNACSDLQGLIASILQMQHSFKDASEEIANQLNSLSQPSDNSQSFEVLVAVYTPEDENPEDNTNPIIESQKSVTSEMIPAIHIMFGSNLTNESYSEWPRFRLILDSSIWNSCIWMKDDISFSASLISVCQRIYNNWENGLYYINSAREYVEFNSRLVQQSYIKGESHGTHVSPFLFHSETVAASNLGHALANPDTIVFGQGGTRRKWRFLLVDDHSEEKVSYCSGSSPKDSRKTKLELLVQRLSSLKKEDGSEIGIKYNNIQPDDCDIEIEYATSVKGLVEKIWGTQTKRYDLILMDYLLGNVENGSGREYSYEFLCLLKFMRDYVLTDTASSENLKSALKSDIDADGIVSMYLKETENGFSLCDIELPSDWDKLRNFILSGIGPNGRLHFMYTSSYVNAVQERLNALAMSRVEKYWFIGRGACPINTPNLFLLNLYKLMQNRVRTFWPLEGYASLDDFWKELFPAPVQGNDKLRSNCKKHFHEILNLQEIFAKVSQNDVKGNNDFASLLTESLFDCKKYDNEFWERMQHLCYLICYGTSQQWPEMWLEYNEVKSRLGIEAAENLKAYIITRSERVGIVNSL